MKVAFSTDRDLNALDRIIQGVKDYNEPYLGKFGEPEHFLIHIENDGVVIAGIAGFMYDDYCRVNWVWVDEQHRNKKLGTSLVHELEKQAKLKNCRIINLDTYDFQAKGFYEKLGFVCLGTIPKYVKGRDFHLMRKTL